MSTQRPIQTIRGYQHPILRELNMRATCALSAHNTFMKATYEEVMEVMSGMPIAAIDMLQAQEKATAAGFVAAKTRVSCFQYGQMQLWFVLEKSDSLHGSTYYRLPRADFLGFFPERAQHIIRAVEGVRDVLGEFQHISALNYISPELWELIETFPILPGRQCWGSKPLTGTITPELAHAHRKLNPLGYAFNDLMAAPIKNSPKVKVGGYSRSITVG